MPASVIVSAPPPAQDPAPTTPVAKGTGLGPQAPDSQASPVPAPQVDEPQQPVPAQTSPAPLGPFPEGLLRVHLRQALFFPLSLPLVTTVKCLSLAPGPWTL